MPQAERNWTSCRRRERRLKSNYAKRRNDAARPRRRPQATARSANPETKGSVRAPRSNVRQLPSERTDRYRDFVAVIVLVLAAVVVTVVAAGDATAFIRGDWPTMFLPLYAFL